MADIYGVEKRSFEQVGQEMWVVHIHVWWRRGARRAGAGDLGCLYLHIWGGEKKSRGGVARDAGCSYARMVEQRSETSRGRRLGVFIFA